MPRLPHLSLLVRYALGLGAVLLPLLISAAVGQFYLLPRLVGPLEKVVTEVLNEMEPVTHVQNALPKAGMPANDYLINADPVERNHFAQLSREVDHAFHHLLATAFGLEQERSLANTAWEEWRQARQLAERILQTPHPQGNPQLTQDMKRLDAHIDRAVGALEQMHAVSSQELKGALPAARAARQHAVLLTMASFLVAFALSLLAGLLLARPVLKSIGALGAAASRLAGGDFTARAVLDRYDDEVGQLALAFNVMAEKIGQHQQRLEELAVHDSLTELLNRRGFYRQLGAEVARAHRYGRSFSLLMLDIDHFKAVNDSCGHPVGDEVLRAIAGRIRDQVRPVDRVARWGGEEFAVILPETTVEGAVNTAERIREAIAGSAIQVAPCRELNLTISIGVATFPEDADTADGLIAAADQALYAAKEAGRNRVCRFTKGHQDNA